ncbi:penicillin-binding transpeptidase domain-containing protein [Gordonia shandongensis]|uniref:penicillin-binding transpeptidase domain-containing protein n=1 Tax=Gordonia shandongensis TaxID=376351 RepID=UPI00040B0E35|nr:penicillin-binding transpeptidase domain-containing protein [Gordonia shandongensis]
MSAVPFRLVPVALVTVCALMFGTMACANTDDGPRDAAATFLDLIADRDLAEAAAATTDPKAARSALASAWEGLSATALSAAPGRIRIDGDVADVDVDYRWTLPGRRTWTADATLTLVRDDDGWTVRWASTALHPRLGADQHLTFTLTTPPRAAVNESDGSEVMVNGVVVGIAFDGAEAARSGDVFGAARQLVDTLRPLVPGLDPQIIAEQSTAQTEPMSIGRISEDDFDRLRDRLAIPGVVTDPQAVLMPRDDRFAPQLLAQVKQTVGSALDGTAGWRVSVVNPNGLVADVVSEDRGRPAPSVLLTVSRTVQDAAQRAVNTVRGKQAMLVAVQASTGRILAVAQNADADKDGLLATTGRYPPGSTFKMVTSAAAFHADMATPDTIVPCPGEIRIGDRTIPNYNGFSLGPVPLETAFADSCNTTFADLASRMGPTDLAHAATAMGIGRQYTVPGLDVATGSVPVEPALVARSEDGFGQGKVLATPLGMALVAAAAQSGRAQTPTLIDGRTTRVAGPDVALEPRVYEQLRPMMRAVVARGTGTAISSEGEVFGKTGEAEVEGGSHAWFAGYRGDIAFASLIVLGGDSSHAVTISRDFLAGIPPEYRP